MTSGIHVTDQNQDQDLQEVEADLENQAGQAHHPIEGEDPNLLELLIDHHDPDTIVVVLRVTHFGVNTNTAAVYIDCIIYRHSMSAVNANINCIVLR